MRRTRAIAAFAVVVLMAMPGAQANPIGPPVPEGAVLHPSLGASCTPESGFDANLDKYYGSNCKRMRIVFGPIVTKPGQNDVLIQPVTIEKPAYDGYMVRFKPNLVTLDPRVTAQTGEIAPSPPVEDVHLHHGTWLNTTRNYGVGPWIASGEEKTVVTWPAGFGLKVQANDVWLFLHMVHNATPRPMTTWVTYDVDYVNAAWAEQMEAGKPRITNTRQIWLDVETSKWHNDHQVYSFNPIYNSQRGWGGPDPHGEYNGTICSYPDQACARFNAHGSSHANGISAQQGIDVSAEVEGWDRRIPYGFFQTGGTAASPKEGTLVLMGGHLHTGGIRDEVEIIRCYNAANEATGCPMKGGLSHLDRAAAAAQNLRVETRLIHVSDAYYWNHGDRTKVGADPDSWDFVMNGVTADHGWKIAVREGDILRLNSVYDSSVGSWYENMGIVMTWATAGHLAGAIDPFAPNVKISRAMAADVFSPNPDLAGTPFAGHPRLPEAAAGWSIPGLDLGSNCVNGGVDTDGKIMLCARGQITHPADPAAANHLNPCAAGCVDLRVDQPLDGPLVNEIQIGGFGYGVADMTAVRSPAGIPRLKIGEPVTFWNADTAAYMWHTITRCAEATCATGATTASHPIANGGLGPMDNMDFESGELGVGIAPSQEVSWTFTPDREGIYTFYCRIHPAMRGAFKVVPADTVS